MSNRLTVAVVASVVLLVFSAGPLVFALDDSASRHQVHVEADFDTQMLDVEPVDSDVTGTVMLASEAGAQHGVLSVLPLTPVTSDVVSAPIAHTLTPVSVSVQQGAVQSGEVDPRENETRRRIYEAVERSPGTYIARLAETTSTPRSTVRYHLRVLEETGLVRSETVRGKQRYVAAGLDDEEATLATAYADEATATVLDALARTMPASVSELAEEIDRTPGTVSHHLDRLETAGLVERERSGNAVLNTLAGPARAMVVDESPTDGAVGHSPVVSDD